MVLTALATLATAQAFVFEDVTVIPMDRERALEHQTVLIQEGVITEIGPVDSTPYPSTARKIDGRGKFLIPGLVDMHNHLFSDSDEFPDELAPDELRVMLANGVTTSRLMSGTREQLALRERIRKGELDLPTLYVSSPQLVGTPRWAEIEKNSRLVTTADEARKAVQDFKAQGYDFIKMTMGVKQPAYDAVMDECKKLGIPGIGHVEPDVGVHRAIEAGQQMEHLDAFLEAILRDDSPIKTSLTQQGLFRKENWTSMDYVDEAKLKALAEKAAKAKVHISPSLAFLKTIYGKQVTEEETRSWPDFRFMPKGKVAEWDRAMKIIYPRISASEKHRNEFIRVRNELVKQIHRAGGKIMAGSDSPDVYLAYGFSMHRELQCLVEAGLSPWAALEAGTRVPAEFLENKPGFGTVEKGKRADLILLEANPLSDITNTRKRAGVMLRGHWYPKAELGRMLDDAAAKFAKVG